MIEWWMTFEGVNMHMWQADPLVNKLGLRTQELRRIWDMSMKV